MHMLGNVGVVGTISIWGIINWGKSNWSGIVGQSGIVIDGKFGGGGIGISNLVVVVGVSGTFDSFLSIGVWTTEQTLLLTVTIGSILALGE
jgi:hypothetical protein